MKRTHSRVTKSLTRRDLLKYAGHAGLTLAAAKALSPFVLGDDEAKSRETIKVGILHSLTGSMAINETSLKDAELMAIDEINKNGGVLGHQVEAIVEDGQSKSADVFPDKAKKLLLEDKVVAVFGCCESFSRKRVLPVFEENNGLLFYPVAYEGNECSKNVVYTGGLPNQQVIPAVEWLMSKEGGSKKKFYLIGSDNVYARTVNFVIAKYLKSKGISWWWEKYTDMGHRQDPDVVDDIKKAAPDVIFSTIWGKGSVEFFNELSSASITADKIPVCSVLIDEAVLRGMDQAKVKGHLAASNYFQSIDTPNNKKFVANYRKFVKDGTRVTTDSVESAYTAVCLWKLAVEKVKSVKLNEVLRAICDTKTPITFDAPGGEIRLDPRNQHTWKPFRIARMIGEDGVFEIIHEKKENGKTALIRPDPYPAVLFDGWDCDWTKSGVIRGKDPTVRELIILMDANEGHDPF